MTGLDITSHKTPLSSDSSHIQFCEKKSEVTAKFLKSYEFYVIVTPYQHSNVLDVTFIINLNLKSSNYSYKF